IFSPKLRPSCAEPPTRVLHATNILARRLALSSSYLVDVDVDIEVQWTPRVVEKVLVDFGSKNLEDWMERSKDMDV
ncbi:hypothetical protein NPIL_81051, partial [Nephila pilipes]